MLYNAQCKHRTTNEDRIFDQHIKTIMEAATCTSVDVCTPAAPNTNILPKIPTVVRHDSQTYMRERKGMPNLNPYHGPVFPKQWYQYDDIYSDPQCKIYVAESSIPNAGLGLFAGVDFVYDEFIDTNPQIVIPLIDPSKYDYSYSRSLLHNYPWSGWTQGAQFESESTSVLYPKIGMIANAHMGLINVEQSSDKIVSERGSFDRSIDYGTGARSLYNAFTFKVCRYEGIEQGSELFIDYGEAYFHDREEAFQMIFPTSSNYEEADEIVREFAARMGNEGVKDEISDETRKAWKDIVRKIEDDGSHEQTRVAFALPEKLEDIKYVAEVGTARYSIPESIRSIKWLEDHGLCLGNLYKGKSNIPYAGNGAFAAMEVVEGDVLVPVVLLPVPRKTFQMEGKRKQLLLNYSFGHPDSSVTLVPYSSGVHFINHSAEPNAVLQWSSSDLYHHEDLEKDTADLKTGLIMEVVALKEIGIGEEVTIDYGSAWEDAWYKHVELWETSETPVNTNLAVTVEALNEDTSKPIRTIDERSYPPCIQTACYSSVHNGTYVYTQHIPFNLRFCNITDRVRKEDDYWYRAKMVSSEHYPDGSKNGDEVTDIPRDAIQFVVGYYCSDMHIENAFRHEIHVPDGIYPEIWLDLDSDDSVHDDDDIQYE